MHVQVPGCTCHTGRQRQRGCRDAEQSERCSSCAVEVIAPWRLLACLTPDATQLAAGPDWGPKPFR